MTNRYETAFGEALYPHLSKPDYKFRPEGLYHTELLVDEKEAQKKKSMHEAALRQFDSMTSALQRNLDARIESEISTLKETEAYKSVQKDWIKIEVNNKQLKYEIK